MRKDRWLAYFWLLAWVCHAAPGLSAGVALPPELPDHGLALDADRGGVLGDRGTRASGSRWAGSVLIWDHSATLETVGLGADIQSRNPTYEMSFRAIPSATLLDHPERVVRLRADLALIREFTNSDTTSERGEWTLTDAELWLSWSENLRRTARSSTDWVLRGPAFRLPTSHASFSSGKILGIGVGTGVDHRLRFGPNPTRLTVRPNLGYMYQLVRANVPTNDSIDRVRLAPAGRSLPSDQLSGTAMPQHEVTASLRADAELRENIAVADFAFGLELGMRYARRYALADQEMICGVVDTGCVAVERAASATRWGVAALFAVDGSVSLHPAVSVNLAYANLSAQLGTDGKRRSILYGPDARLSLGVTLDLDAVHRAFAGGGTAGRKSAVRPPDRSSTKSPLAVPPTTGSPAHSGWD